MRPIYLGWRNIYSRLLAGMESIERGEAIEDVPLPEEVRHQGLVEHAISSIKKSNAGRKLHRMPETSSTLEKMVIGWGEFTPRDEENRIYPINSKISETHNKRRYSSYRSPYGLSIRQELVSLEELDDIEFSEDKPALIGRTDVAAHKARGAELVFSREHAVRVLEEGGILLRYYDKLRQFRTLFWRGADLNISAMTGVVLKKKEATTSERGDIIISSSSEHYSMSYKHETVMRVASKAASKTNPYFIMDGEKVDVDNRDVVGFVHGIIDDTPEEIVGCLNYGAIDWALCSDGRVIVFEVNSAPGISSPRSEQFMAGMLIHLVNASPENIKELSRLPASIVNDQRIAA